MTERKHIDWDAVRQRYNDGKTWDQLATEFSVSHQSIANHVREGDWEKRRAEYNLEIAKRIQNNHVRSTVKDMTAFNKTCEESAEIACNISKHCIGLMHNRLAKNNEEPDPKRLLDLIKISREALEMKRLINNIPPPSALLEQNEEWAEFQREMARLQFSRTNGNPANPQKEVIAKLEPPAPPDKLN
jgi:hypothetical protein